MSRPCPRCQVLQKGAFYRENGEWICESCFSSILEKETRGAVSYTAKGRKVAKFGQNTRNSGKFTSIHDSQNG